MKTIEPISIWDNGQVQEAYILDSYASNVRLNNSATFQYTLYSKNGEYVGNQLSQGILIMDGIDYQEWNEDEFAWDWVAAKLNLVITGDYIRQIPLPPPPPPPIEPIIDTPITE